MKLTVVGWSGSFPGPDSPASCYLVEHDGSRVLLDMGNGSLGALQRYTDMYALDAILLSHLHVDHCVDLTSYYVARRFGPDGPMPSMPVYGPGDTAGRMADAYGMARQPGMRDQFTFGNLERGAFEVGPFRVESARVNHPVEAYAIRVSAGGRSIVYSGDTGPTKALVDISRDADLALYESSFVADPDNPPNLHLTGGDAAEHASRAGVGRLMLTHLVPWNDTDRVVAEAAAAYNGELLVAGTGVSVEI